MYYNRKATENGSQLAVNYTKGTDMKNDPYEIADYVLANDSQMPMFDRIMVVSSPSRGYCEIPSADDSNPLNRAGKVFYLVQPLTQLGLRSQALARNSLIFFVEGTVSSKTSRIERFWTEQEGQNLSYFVQTQNRSYQLLQVSKKPSKFRSFLKSFFPSFKRKNMNTMISFSTFLLASILSITAGYPSAANSQESKGGCGNGYKCISSEGIQEGVRLRFETNLQGCPEMSASSEADHIRTLFKKPMDTEWNNILSTAAQFTSGCKAKQNK